MSMYTSSSGQSSGDLSLDDQPSAPGQPLTVADVGAENVSDQWSAVINIHDSDLHQIEVALAANTHEVDPHPALPGRFVRRHPVYLVAVDYSQLDSAGNPAPGKPRELDLEVIRGIFSSRAAFIAAGPPPADGSHINVENAHTIAEFDSSGNPTGRVRLGTGAA
jgi:hypothetical protein